MNDLRKAAEMALEALRNAEVVHMKQLNAMYALQEALAHEEQPWVKSYCGGKPNYCTPEVTPDVDAVNMTPDRVDETAKGEHNPEYDFFPWSMKPPPHMDKEEPEWVATIGNWGKVQWREDVFPQLGAKLYSAPPKHEWNCKHCGETNE